MQFKIPKQRARIEKMPSWFVKDQAGQQYKVSEYGPNILIATGDGRSEILFRQTYRQLITYGFYTEL